MANYGLDRMPSDMLAAGFEDLHVIAYCPVEDQAKIVEMLRLALSREMRETLIDHQIAAADDIDAAVAAMHARRRRLPDQRLDGRPGHRA
jgi:hypothetical protein